MFRKKAPRQPLNQRLFGPDFNTVLRKSREPTRRIRATHAACHMIATI